MPAELMWLFLAILIMAWFLAILIEAWTDYLRVMEEQQVAVSYFVIKITHLIWFKDC